MKLIKSLALGALAVSFVGSASAASYVVNVCGSTAYRNATTLAEYSYLSSLGGHTPSNTAGVTVEGAYSDSGKGFSPAGKCGSGKSILHTIVGADDYYFINTWTGSAAGAADLATANQLQFATTSTAMSDITSTSTVNNGTQGVTTALATPNLAMVDVQISDISASIATCGSAGGKTGAYFAGIINGLTWVDAGLTAGPKGTVGTCNFEWVLGKGATPFSGLSAQNAAALIKNGYLRLSTITGNSGDENAYVFFLGRNEDSGTRIEYLAEATGGGTAAGCQLTFGSSVSQFMVKQAGVAYPTSSTYTGLTTGTGIEGFKIWPARWTVNTIPSLNWNTAGHSGYNGGSDVVAILSTPNTGDASSWSDANIANAPSDFAKATTKVYFVSSLGASDAATAVGNGATALAYGNSGAAVDLSAANITTGKYSLWTWEHAYYLAGSATNALSGTPKNMADGLADTIYGFSTSTLYPVGVKAADVICTRGATAGVYIQ